MSIVPTELGNNENNVKQFYTHDLVYKFDECNRIRFGVVSVSYEDSDSSDQFSSTLQKGQILVKWDHPMRKQVCKQSKLHLMSRCILAGDIVRRLQDGKETQRGYCKAIKQYATVQIVESNKVVEHVSDSRLCFVRPFSVGDAVTFNGNFGRIQDMEDTIRMQSKCGSIVEINPDDNYQIRDYWSHLTLGNDPCYPGQTVICVPRHFKDPKWIKKTKLMKRRMEVEQTFTIQNVHTTLMSIWRQLPSGSTEIVELKDDEIKKIKVIPFDNHLIVWDRFLLKIKPTDIFMNKKEWLKKKARQYLPVPNNITTVQGLANGVCNELDDDWCTEDDDDEPEEDTKQLSELATAQYVSKVKTKRKCPRKPNKHSIGSIVAVEVLCTESRATIVWQDGTEEKDVPTTELYYSVSLDDHEFFPGECVVPNNNDCSERYGVVQKVNFQERTADVKWFNFGKLDDQPGEVMSNEMSVYDLKKHVKFVFRPGSVVKSKTPKDDRMGKVIDSCPEGYVIVQWLGGTTENCWPQHIELIPDRWDLNFPDDFDSYDSNDETNSWETESIESCYGDLADEITLQNMAAKVNFIRNRICYLHEAFKQHNINRNFCFVKDLLCVYDNSSYLDKYLGTSFFSLESKHFQALLTEFRKKAKASGIDLKDSFCGMNSKHKNAEKENIQKMIRLETKVNAQIDSIGKDSSTAEACTPQTPECETGEKMQENLCVELLIMLKLRMDLVYAEIISRIGDRQALTVLSTTTTSQENTMKFSTSDIALQNISPLLTPEDILIKPNFPKEQFGQDGVDFQLLDEAPESHHYYQSKFQPIDLQKFIAKLQHEYNLLRESLPTGVWVRTYCDRMDLLSVMIRGPAKTPYEDGLFLFDMQLGPDYPKSPPLVHYISFSSEALNPNLYVEGKVCVSLLGTWVGRDNEVWGPKSTLLQVIVSIQGLILVAEPYYNEAGYDRQSHTQQGYENSRTYNELVLLKLVQSMTELLKQLPIVFKSEVLQHFKQHGESMCERLLKYCDDENPLKPEFSLLPVSKGLKLSLKSAMDVFREELQKTLSNNALSEQTEDKNHPC